MRNDTTIRLEQQTKEKMKELKDHSKQSYNDLIKKLIKTGDANDKINDLRKKSFTKD